MLDDVTRTAGVSVTIPILAYFTGVSATSVMASANCGLLCPAVWWLLASFNRRRLYANQQPHHNHARQCHTPSMPSSQAYAVESQFTNTALLNILVWQNPEELSTSLWRWDKLKCSIRALKNRQKHCGNFTIRGLIGFAWNSRLQHSYDTCYMKMWQQWCT